MYHIFVDLKVICINRTTVRVHTAGREKIVGIGIGLKRRDALAKVTGEAAYTEDLIPGNALVVKLLRSTIANGKVLAIDISDARSMPGIVDIVTCFDTPQTKYATAGHPHSVDPAHPDVANMTMLTSRVRYYGDKIAAVVAEDEISAKHALKKVHVTYEEYEPYFDAGHAVGNAHPLHDDCPDNQLARMDFDIDPDDQVHFYKTSFSESGEIGKKGCGVYGTHFHTSMQQHVHMENIACFAYKEGDQTVIVSPSQMPHTCKLHVAQALHISMSKITVIQPYIGGGFGNKQDTYDEPLLAYLTNRLNGRCVSLVYDREETFTDSRVRHMLDIYAYMKVSEDGRMEDQSVRINSNGGAYASNGNSVTAYAVTNYFELYPCRGQRIGESMTYYSNLPSSGAMRGYGIPQITFAVESLVDDICYEHGWDPVAFRMKNLMPKDFFDPFDRFSAGSNGVRECLEKGRQMINWDEKRKQYQLFNERSKRIKKGVGVGVFCYKTGVYPIQLETASARLSVNADGTLVVQTGASELGQGSDTVMAQMASEILTIPENRIHVAAVKNTDSTPHDAGAYASRQTYVSGAAVKETALQLKNKILEKASLLTLIPMERLYLKQEKIYERHVDRPVMSIGDVAMQMLYGNSPYRNSEQLTAEVTYTAHSNCFSFGVSYVDLDVDLMTGRMDIHRVVAVHDSGTIINPKLAEAQIQGGIMMGLGYAVTEQLLFDKKSGRPLNNNLLDYKIPTAMDVPEIDVSFVETYEPTGPFGNKALAEPPTIPQAPAVRNAVLFATGVGIYELPMNPQALVHAFKKENLI